MLVDGQGRQVGYVRLSLTDRCNFRCGYCMPENGVPLLPKNEQLTVHEIGRLGRVLHGLGIARVRLTGGEPLIRPDIVDIVRTLARIGFADLSITTNGHYLADLAQPLRDAGLSRVTISLDSLDPGRFSRVTRRGELPRVLDGITAATAAFARVKLNTVVLGGINDDELPALAEFAWRRGLTPRFIETMPLSSGLLFVGSRFVSAAQMRARLAAAFGVLVPSDGSGVKDGGPARYYATPDGRRLGLIAAVTEPFCDGCNRMRISSTGRMQACLGHDDEVDLLTQLRSGVATDEAIAEEVRGALLRKVSGHGFASCGTGGPKKHMVTIGG